MEIAAAGQRECIYGGRKRMKTKAAWKMAVDICMLLALLFLMGYQLWGEAAH